MKRLCNAPQTADSEHPAVRIFTTPPLRDTTWPTGLSIRASFLLARHVNLGLKPRQSGIPIPYETFDPL